MGLVKKDLVYLMDDGSIGTDGYIAHGENMHTYIVNIAHCIALEKERKIKFLYTNGKFFKIKVKINKILNYRNSSVRDYAFVKVKRIKDDKIKFFLAAILGVEHG